MEFIKKYLRDISSSSLMLVGYCLLFFIAFNGIYLVNKMAEKQPDTIVGNYTYKEAFRVLRQNADTEDGNKEFDQEKNVAYVLSALDIKQGNSLVNLNAVVRGAAGNHSVSVMLSWNEPCNRKLQSGQYPDFEKTEDRQAAVIGEYFLDYVEKIDGKKYININGENYFVSGVFKSLTDNGLDDSLVLFYSDFNAEVKKAINSQLYSNYMEVVLCGDSGNGRFIEEVKSNIAKNPFYKMMNMDLNAQGGINIVISKIREVVMIMIILFCIINSFAITNLWLIRRRSEIAVRKACGYSYFQIIKLISFDMLKLMGGAAVLAAMADICYMTFFKHTIEIWYIYRYCAYTALLVVFILFSSVMIHIEIIAGISPAKGVQR